MELSQWLEKEYYINLLMNVMNRNVLSNFLLEKYFGLLLTRNNQYFQISIMEGA